MPIWKTQPVDVQPQLSLESWRVHELPDGDRHLIGYCVENREGRVTSSIQSFDNKKMVAVTRSGRVYSMLGGPGMNPDAMYTWGRWADINKVDDYTDVTEAVYQEHRDAIAA